MTIDEFIERLWGTPRRGWRINGAGQLRRGQYCPIIEIDPAHESAGAGWIESSRNIGLAHSDAVKIVDAVDKCGTMYDPALRARLLEAVGLEEEPA